MNSETAPPWRCPPEGVNSINPIIHRMESTAKLWQTSLVQPNPASESRLCLSVFVPVQIRRSAVISEDQRFKRTWKNPTKTQPFPHRNWGGREKLTPFPVPHMEGRMT